MSSSPGKKATEQKDKGVSKEEFIKLRQPPSKPAFANDGKNLNLETHDMLTQILNHKFTAVDKP